LPLRDNISKPITNDLAPRRSDNVSYEQYAHVSAWLLEAVGENDSGNATAGQLRLFFFHKSPVTSHESRRPMVGNSPTKAIASVVSSFVQRKGADCLAVGS
jgi:hypothetical protein